MEVSKDIVFFPFNRAKRQLGLTQTMHVHWKTQIFV